MLDTKRHERLIIFPRLSCRRNALDGGKHALFQLDPCSIQTVSRTLIADAQISRETPRKCDVRFATLICHLNLRTFIGIAVVLLVSNSVTIERTSCTPGSFMMTEKTNSWYQITSGAMTFNMRSNSPNTV